MAPSPSWAASMNAGLTPIIPLDTTRMLATAAGLNPGASMMAVNMVGGPIMKLMRSAPMRPRPRSTSHRSMSTVRMDAAPGTSTPLSKPEMWASGAGISTASLPDKPCTPVMVSDL